MYILYKYEQNTQLFIPILTLTNTSKLIHFLVCPWPGSCRRHFPTCSSFPSRLYCVISSWKMGTSRFIGAKTSEISLRTPTCRPILSATMSSPDTHTTFSWLRLFDFIIVAPSCRTLPNLPLLCRLGPWGVEELVVSSPWCALMLVCLCIVLFWWCYCRLVALILLSCLLSV